MASDYAQILRDNLRAYGESTKHLQLLKRLYADRTHFIYELIQNAEDAGASRMSLTLFPDRLEVMHDGRLFDEADVRGICGVAEGSKEHDLTQIGKFGIGFKSVYAFTSRPEVHCGDEHFAIEDFVRPSALEPETVPTPWTTLFRLPLDGSVEGGAHASLEKIGARLRALNPLTLLFLRHVSEIVWEIPGTGNGAYRREESEAEESPRRVWVVGEESIDGTEESSTEGWVIFSRSVDHLAPEMEPSQPRAKLGLRAEVAYRDISNGSSSPIEVATMARSPLAVFFLTEYDTRLGFLVQGPYRTTPARDNIPKDDRWNQMLMEETARLVVESLEQLKDQGLLTVRVLETMPLKSTDFVSAMCEPIFLAVREAFRRGAFLPIEGGRFSRPSETKLGRGSDLRDLLTPEELAELKSAANPLHWISSEVMTEKQADLRSYIVEELGVEEIDPESFARSVTVAFLQNRSDSWMVSFYSFLRGQQALWRETRRDYYGGYLHSGVLRSKSIIRLSDGNHVAPFGADGRPQVYLPVDEGDELPGDLPTVSRTIASDKIARQFLEKDLGLPAPDAVARMRIPANSATQSG